MKMLKASSGNLVRDFVVDSLVPPRFSFSTPISVSSLKSERNS